MRKMLFALAVFIAISGLALAYMPSVYIANPDTGACQYYFSGDTKHYNPVPNGTWQIVGMSGVNFTDCQYRCFFNSDRFWQALLDITQNNLTLDGIGLDYRILTNLSCTCMGEGATGCENWCHASSGLLNSTNWSDSVGCLCEKGIWQPGKGCAVIESNATSQAQAGRAAESWMSSDILKYTAVLAAGLVAGWIFSRKVKFVLKKEKPHENKQ